MSASSNISEFLAGLHEARERVEAAALRAADQAGEQVIGDAQQLCPVATGFLQGSGTTLPATIEGGKVQKIVGFNAGYAAAVHENLAAHHTVGQAKYLSTAVQNDGPKVNDFIVEEMRKAL